MVQNPSLYIHLDGALMFYPCLFYPSDNVWHSRRTDAPRCAHFFYLFHTFLDHTTKIRRKERAPSRVSVAGAPNAVHNCHLDKTNKDNSSMHLFIVYFLHRMLPFEYTMPTHRNFRSRGSGVHLFDDKPCGIMLQAGCG